MAESKNKTAQASTDGTETTAADGGKSTQRVVPKEMRTLFAEITRLSRTLAIARDAMYDSDPAKSRKALDLLSRQVPQAVEIAELLMPSAE
jgi:hypothetical protein